MEPVEYQLMSSLEKDFWWYKGLHRIVADRLSRLQLPHGAAVLDAGCGTGGMLAHLLSSPVTDALFMTGLEWESAAAELAASKTGLNITRGSINNMPYPDAIFDAILSQDVLYHTNVDEAAAVGEFYRCLKPGGYLLISLPAFEWMRSAHDEHVHGARRYTAERCRTLLTSHRFSDIRVGYWNSLLFPLMIIHRLTAGRQQETSDVRPLPHWLNSMFFTILDSERRLGLKLPFGGTVWAIARRN